MTIATDDRHRPKFGLTHRLVLAREVAGLEQIDLAEALGVARSTISNYERGVSKPGKLQLNAWAVTCDVDVEWLKTGTETPVMGGPDGGLDSSAAPSRAALAQSVERFTRNDECNGVAPIVPIRRAA